MATTNVRLLDGGIVRNPKLCATPNNRSLIGEAQYMTVDAVRDAPLDKRSAFLAQTTEWRFASEGRRQTPSELLIREDRDHGH